MIKMASFLKINSRKIELGIITEDDKEMNEELGMYFQAEEQIYFMYKKDTVVYGFTNKAVIKKEPVDDYRVNVTRYPFSQYFVTKTNIKDGKQELDVEVTFTLNRYDKASNDREFKVEFTLSIDKKLMDYAAIIYKLLALLEEKQQEQRFLEERMLSITKDVLARNSQTAQSLEQELLTTKDWLLKQVFSTQFSNIHLIFEDSMKGYIIHMNKESDGELFNNIIRQFMKEDAETIIEVDAEIIK